MRKLFAFIKSLLSKKRYLIEYKIENYTSNYIVRAYSEESAISQFSEIWDRNMGGLYPYQSFQVVSVKKIINKLSYF